jgi:hypothetical protein
MIKHWRLNSIAAMPAELGSEVSFWDTDEGYAERCNVDEASGLVSMTMLSSHH